MNSANLCPWAETDPLMKSYHDTEWGRPCRDDGKLFEMLVLEGMQAGLSWRTVLYKRENMRRAFDGFDPEKAARYGDEKIASLLSDAGIIRNRAKIAALVANARAFLKVREEFGSFADYAWELAGGSPVINRWESQSEIPCSTPVSDFMSASLRKRGFKFVGTTICYSFMQAVGMVNDHIVGCRFYEECAALGRKA